MKKLLDKIPANHRRLLSVYITFIIFIAINWYFDRSMFTINRMSTLSVQFAPMILMAMAQSLIMLTGGIDLSSGAVLSLMTAVLATTMQDSTGGMLMSFVITLLCGTIVGLIMGIIVTYGRLPAIIVTLAFMYIWRGVALMVLPVPGGYVAKAFTTWLGTPSIFFPGFVIVGGALIFWKLLKNSKFGINLYAVGDSEKAAYANGISTKIIRILAYGLSGFFIALAGITLAGRTGSGDPMIGETYQLNSVAAAVLGGVAFTGGDGQLKGTVMGAIIITSLMNILFFSGVSPFYQYIVQGGILIIALGGKTISHYRKGGAVDI